MPADLLKNQNDTCKEREGAELDWVVLVQENLNHKAMPADLSLSQRQPDSYNL